MPVIRVVGLGPGSLGALPLTTWQMLNNGLPVLLRTAVHPVVLHLKESGVRFESFDSLYESGDSFDEVYDRIADQVIQAAHRHGEVVYAVPGHPLMAEQTVQNLLQRCASNGVQVDILAGQSFFDAVCTALQVDPVQGMLLLDGTNLSVDQLVVSVNTLIMQLFNRETASEVKLTLMEAYPDDYPVRIVRAAGVPDEEQIVDVPIYELDRVDTIDHLTTLFIPAMSAELQGVGDPWYVASLVKRLRAPEGCPWDREQTHASLRPYVIEEAYELAHAIDQGDSVDLTSELGDLLLQVLLHAEIASETGEFSFREVCKALADKLLRRHPHVFGDVKATNEDEAQAVWAEAKRQEQAAVQAAAHNFRSLLENVDVGRPALVVALDLQRRAAKVGFDWDNAEAVLAKIREEVGEFAAELASSNRDAMEEEIGDLLFGVVNLARWLDLDMERALSRTNDKFASRFTFIEKRLFEQGKTWSDTSMVDWDRYWEEAKRAKLRE